MNNENKAEPQAKAAYTPGSWVYTQEDGVIESEGGSHIAIPQNERCGRPIVGPAEVHANGRLIAAAPDLLAACKHFMACLEDGTLVRDISADASRDFTMKMMHFVKDLNAAQLAIAKAEGRA